VPAIGHLSSRCASYGDNVTITMVSGLIALLIGGIEALRLLVDRLGCEGRIWSIISGLNGDLANLGLAAVGIFAATWGVSRSCIAGGVTIA
jgi:nickel/cobalt transporter (NiCoT) family protein